MLKDLRLTRQLNHVLSAENSFIMKIRFLKTFLIFVAFVVVDQVSKYLIRSKGGFYICNVNLAWGIELPPVIFWLTWGLVIFFVLIFGISCSRIFNFKFPILNRISNNKYQIPDLRISVILILAGAISNAMDRIFVGCVTDFIDLKFWPVFNFADVFIVLGVVILLVRKLRV